MREQHESVKKKESNVDMHKTQSPLHYCSCVLNTGNLNAIFCGVLFRYTRIPQLVRLVATFRQKSSLLEMRSWSNGQSRSLGV